MSAHYIYPLPLSFQLVVGGTSQRRSQDAKLLWEAKGFKNTSFQLKPKENTFL